jgi:beta-N-acetylhexosaminidase
MRTRSVAVLTRAGTLPVAGAGAGEWVLVTGWNSSAHDNVPALAGALAARGVSATALVTNLPNDATTAQAVAAAGTKDLTVVLTSRALDTTTADPDGRQHALIRALVATGRPVVVVAVRDPRDFAHHPGVTTYVRFRRGRDGAAGRGPARCHAAATRGATGFGPSRGRSSVRPRSQVEGPMTERLRIRRSVPAQAGSPRIGDPA